MFVCKQLERSEPPATKDLFFSLSFCPTRIIVINDLTCDFRNLSSRKKKYVVEIRDMVCLDKVMSSVFANACANTNKGC